VVMQPLDPAWRLTPAPTNALLPTLTGVPPKDLNPGHQAESPQVLAALRLLAESPCEVALVPLSMPGMEGSALADIAAISNAQVSLSYAEIRSPLDGRTGNLAVKKGNVVKAPDDVLLTITQVHPIYVAFSVPEQHLPAIRRESGGATLAVEAVVPGEDHRPVRGELTFVNNMVDTNTGTIQLKATFANEDDRLWPGDFVNARLLLDIRKGAVVIPSTAVQRGPNGPFAWVVTASNTVEPRSIELGAAEDDLVVVTSGIQAAERVVTRGQDMLQANASVNIASPPASTASMRATRAGRCWSPIPTRNRPPVPGRALC